MNNETDPGHRANSQQDDDPFAQENDEDIDLESVRALTLKDGIDYENDY